MRRLPSSGYLKAGWDALRGAKLRSFWTMLGVIIGVASVITIVGLGEGVKEQISGQLHNLNKNLITVRPAQIGVGGSTNPNTNLFSGLAVNGYLTPNDVATVQKTSGVVASAPLAVVGGKVTGMYGAYTGGYVIGTTPDMASLLSQQIAFGAFLTSDDEGTNSAVLGSHVVSALFNEDVPLGRSFTFHGQQFIVRGILSETGTTLFSQQVNVNNAIFIPYDVGEQLNNNSAPTYQIVAKAANSSASSQVASAIKHNLDRTHGGQSNLSVALGSQNVASSDYILELLTRMIAGVAAISLLVGGVGIMNVMLVSVAERVHEIGIRKAVGATNQQILSQFLAEATVLGLAGGVIGIIVAILVDVGLRLFTSLQPVITWQVVVGATLVSLLVGIIFGTAPAIKAAHKDPIEALRSE